MQTHPVGDKASLSGIRRRIRADLARAGVDPAKTFDCLVAVTEACANALLRAGAAAVDVLTLARVVRPA